jgi:folate-binding protein YgfZ
MNPHWRSFLESTEGVFDGDSTELLNFGDAAGELQAAARQTVVVPLTHLGLIEATGEDGKAFLHSQLTNDVNHLVDGQTQHAGWCNAKGRMQASFLVWHLGTSYFLALAADLQETTQKRLQMFVLRSKVKLASLTDSTVMLGLSGPQAEEALADAALPCPSEAMTTAANEGAMVIRLDAGRFMIVAPESAMAALWQKLDAQGTAGRIASLALARHAGRLPAGDRRTKEEFVPQMADFEKIGGVSFHKGCYPGQEIVARTQYLGKVKRHLYRVQSDQC